MLTDLITTYAQDTTVQFSFAIPLILNAIIYPIHVWDRVQKDRKAAETTSSYGHEYVTIGDLVWYLFLTVTPLINAIAAVFHTGPIALSLLNKMFGDIFSITLVKKPPKIKFD